MRSFDEGIIVSRPSAVGRDVIADLYALSKFESLLFYADSCNPKIRHRIATGASDLPMRTFLILAIFGFRRVAAFDVEILSSMLQQKPKIVPRCVYGTSRKHPTALLPSDVFGTQQFR